MSPPPIKSKVVESSKPSLSLILEEIQALRVNTDTIALEVKNVRKDMASLSMKISDNSIKIQDNKTKLDSFTPLVAKISPMSSALLDLENRNRQYNLRIFNLPEDVEGNNCRLYLENLLPGLLQLKFSEKFEVDKAHRIPSHRNPCHTKPRQMIFKVLRHHHLVLIRKAAREIPSLMVNGNKIFIHQDFARETVSIRKEFMALRPQLRSLGYKYGLFDPSTMRIWKDSFSKSFQRPEDL